MKRRRRIFLLLTNTSHVYPARIPALHAYACLRGQLLIWKQDIYLSYVFSYNNQLLIV